MAKVTWLGEGENGPEETQAYGQTFKVGESADITDETLLNKARANQYFDVAGDKSPTVEDDPALAAGSQGQPAAIGAEVKNAAFGTQEELDAHRQRSIEAAERNDEIQRRGPGRPRGSKNQPKGTTKRASKRRAGRANPQAGKRPASGGDDYSGEHVPPT